MFISQTDISCGVYGLTYLERSSVIEDFLTGDQVNLKPLSTLRRRIRRRLGYSLTTFVWSDAISAGNGVGLAKLFREKGYTVLETKRARNPNSGNMIITYMCNINGA